MQTVRQNKKKEHSNNSWMITWRQNSKVNPYIIKLKQKQLENKE